MRKIINKLKLSGFKKQASASISKANDYRGYEFEQLVTEFNKCKDKVELFALLTEISERTVGLRPYKVQIMAAMACSSGCVIDMKTGEGKTLVAALAAIALQKEGYVSVVATANNYLASRDLELMSPLYKACGIKVSRIRSPQGGASSSDVYYSHLTEESCLSWLSDHLAVDVNEITHPQLLPSSKTKTAIIVDEIDHSLIDSSSVNYSIVCEIPAGTYSQQIATLCQEVGKQESFIEYDEDGSGEFSQAFYSEVESALIEAGIVSSHEELYDEGYEMLLHYRSAYTAFFVLEEDTDYVVRNGMLLTIDPRSGRLTSSGFAATVNSYLHAKHNLEQPSSNEEIVSCALQHYIDRFDLLSGMSGTAIVNELELNHSYGARTLEIPQNKPTQRTDHGYIMFENDSDRLLAVSKFLGKASREQRPTLVICSSEAEAESVANALIQNAIKVTLLTSSNVEQEAEILSEAGRMGSMIVTTRMCGRGTDIVCEDVERGLLILTMGMGVTENDDKQVIGRTGRQGAKGDTYFCLSKDSGIFAKAFSPTSPVTAALIQTDLDNIDVSVSGATTRLVRTIQKQRLAALREGRKRVAIYNKPIDSQLSLLMLKREKLLFASDPLAYFYGLTPNSDAHSQLIEHYESKFPCKEDFSAAVKRGIAEGLNKCWHKHHREVVNIKADTSVNAKAASNINNFKKSCFESFEQFAKTINEDLFEYTINYLSKQAVAMEAKQMFSESTVSAT